MYEVDLFGKPITYIVACIICNEFCEVLEKPPNKQLSFFVCKDCREEENVEDNNATLT